MDLRFCCGVLCLSIFRLRPGNGETITSTNVTKTDVLMPNYVPSITAKDAKESGNETLCITAYNRLIELWIDEIEYAIYDENWYPNVSLYTSIPPSTRLIAMYAQNNGTSSCGGVLASTSSNSIITDERFKCVNSYVSDDWMKFGFDDFIWTDANEYENNMAGRSNCHQDDPIAGINPNANWIWLNRDADSFVYCRGYTNFCTTSPCLNGGTCTINNPNMCMCEPTFTGKYCETEIIIIYDDTTATSDVPETTSIVSTTSFIPTTTSFVPSFPGPDPCTHYQFIEMADGFRSSEFNSSCHSTISMCDSNLKNGTWYRFEHDAGNRLLEGRIDPWFCGTQAPIYLNETRHINEFEAMAEACAVYNTSNTCGWSGQVFIRSCSLYGETFIVYQLAVPTSCPLAYCVDASSRRQCVPPEVWISDEFRCGEDKPPSATPIPPSEPCEEPPSGSGWSDWGPWSECTKSCDYGLESRRRLCGEIPCAGLSTEFQSCNQFDCPTITEQKEQGVAINLKTSDQTQDSLLSVIQNEEIIYEQLRVTFNGICSQNGSLCCGSNYAGSGTQEYVTLGSVYRAQGGLTPNADGTISLHVIAEANGTLCGVEAQRITKRETKSTVKIIIPYETMYMAANMSVLRIHENTGLTIVKIDDPATMYIINDENEDKDDCSLEGCVIPIVVCLVGALVIIIAAIIVYRYWKKKQSEDDDNDHGKVTLKSVKRKSPYPPGPPPPSYFNSAPNPPKSIEVKQSTTPSTGDPRNDIGTNRPPAPSGVYKNSGTFA